MREGGEEEEIRCFFAGKRRGKEKGVIRKKSEGKIKRTGIQTKPTKKRERGQNRAAWSLQVTPSNLHPTSVQQGSESPPPCASSFLLPGEEICSAADRQMALPLPVLLWGIFPDGELEGSLCCYSLPLQQPWSAWGLHQPVCPYHMLLRHVHTCSLALWTFQLNPLEK